MSPVVVAMRQPIAKKLPSLGREIIAGGAGAGTRQIGPGMAERLARQEAGQAKARQIAQARRISPPPAVAAAPGPAARAMAEHSERKSVEQLLAAAPKPRVRGTGAPKPKKPGKTVVHVNRPVINTGFAREPLPQQAARPSTAVARRPSVIEGRVISSQQQAAAAGGGRAAIGPAAERGAIGAQERLAIGSSPYGQVASPQHAPNWEFGSGEVPRNWNPYIAAGGAATGLAAAGLGARQYFKRKGARIAAGQEAARIEARNRLYRNAAIGGGVGLGGLALAGAASNR